MEALGINISGLATQIISFLVLLVALYALLYKPLLAMLDQRSESIRESLEIAEKTKSESARSSRDVERQLQDSRLEGQAMLEKAREAAERYREEELSKAREEIDNEKQKAQAEIKRERDLAIEELRREFGGLAVSAAEKIIVRNIDESVHQDLIARVLEEDLKVESG